MFFDVQNNLTFRFVMDKIQSKSMFGTVESRCCNIATPFQIGLLFLLTNKTIYFSEQ